MARPLTHDEITEALTLMIERGEIALNYEGPIYTLDEVCEELGINLDD